MILLKFNYNYILIFLLLPLATFPQTKAITDDGKVVILYEDGTWKYADSTKSTLEEHTFRNTNWGMSPAEVKQSETAKFLQQKNNMLLYSDNVSGLKSFIGYVFAENKLVRARYSIIEKHTNKNDFLTDYKNLKEIITNKYGNPKEDKTVWRNDLYKNNFQDWGRAVSIGHLVLMSNWETPKSTIYLGLYGDNYDIDLVVEYASIKLKILEDQEKEQKKLNEF